MILFISFLSEIIHLEGIKLSSGREILPSASPKLLDISKDGWYYINCKDSKSIDQITKLGIKISSISFISPHWICEYLTIKQVQQLSQNLFISKVLPSDKLQNAKLLDQSESTKYLIYAHDSFIPDNSYQRIYKNYFVTNSLSNKLLENPKILFATPYSSPQLLNRFSRGETQQANFSVIFDKNLVIPDLPFHRHGIKGSGQIVTMVDSGLDYRLCYFKDDNRSVPFDITDFSHRKVVRYETAADNQDANQGHGSHVGGIIAGNAQCDNCAASLYNGHAPDAKLYVVDAGYVNNPSELGGKYDMGEISQTAAEIGSHIMSNSWGYRPNDNIDVRILFDMLCYEMQNITYFFGSGNSNKLYDIWAPSNSKNVISVGGSTKPAANQVFSQLFNNKYVYLEKANCEREKCDFSSSPISFNTRTTTDPIPNFQNQTIGTSFIILHNEEDCKKIHQAETNLLITSQSISCKSKILTCKASESFLSEIKDNDKCSLAIDYVSESNSVSLGSYTSKGPANTGLLKPDIYAPGTLIRSAFGMSLRSGEKSCINAQATTEKSGTSMATPAAAGTAALLAEYLMKGYYPTGSENLNDSLTPHSALMKALLINSATPLKGGSSIPNANYGFGSIHIYDGVFFADENERMETYGLRISNPTWYVDGDSHSEYIGKIHLLENVSQPKPLVITMAWLDPPTSKAARPIYADLDLFVESPDGKIYFGNRNDDNEEAYSTVERVTILSPIGGEYSIHVICPHFSGNEHIYPYVVVNGPFCHLDFDKNPKFIDFPLKFTDNVCAEINKTGHLCQHDVENLISDDVYPVNLPLRKAKYYYFQYTEGVMNLSLSVTKGQHLTHLYLSTNQVGKFGGNDFYFRSLDRDVLLVLSEKVVNKGDFIYITLIELLNQNYNMKIKIIDSNQHKNTPSSTISASATPSESLLPTQSLDIIPQSLLPEPSFLPTSSHLFSFFEHKEESEQVKKESFKMNFYWAVLITTSVYIGIALLVIVLCKPDEERGIVQVTSSADNIDPDDHSSQSLLQNTNPSVL